jgi:hypothetical protein
MRSVFSRSTRDNKPRAGPARNLKVSQGIFNLDCQAIRTHREMTSHLAQNMPFGRWQRATR